MFENDISRLGRKQREKKIRLILEYHSSIIIQKFFAEG